MALGARGRPSQILRAQPDILAQVGGTPLVRLGRLPDPKGARVYAKLEQFNPGGSVKDRLALSMVLDAERRGLLKPGGTILEPTSGNTGIGLAMVGAVRGYRVIIVLSESMSHERHSLLTSYGAEVVFSSGEEGMMGSVVKAEEILAEHPDYFIPQQFNNPPHPPQGAPAPLGQDVGLAPENLGRAPARTQCHSGFPSFSWLAPEHHRPEG